MVTARKILNVVYSDDIFHLISFTLISVPDKSILSKESIDRIESNSFIILLCVFFKILGSVCEIARQFVQCTAFVQPANSRTAQGLRTVHSCHTGQGLRTTHSPRIRPAISRTARIQLYSPRIVLQPAYSCTAHSLRTAHGLRTAHSTRALCTNLLNCIQYMYNNKTLPQPAVRISQNIFSNVAYY